MAKAACSVTSAPRSAPTLANHPSSPRRRHSVATAATAPTAGAPSATSPLTSMRSRCRWDSNATTMRSSCPDSRSALTSPRRSSVRWPMRAPSRTVSTSDRYS